MNNNGIKPELWGPGMWHNLHMIASTYPVKPTKQDKEQYFNFIVSLGNILPCGECRDNFKHEIIKLDFGMNSLSNQESFFKFVFNLHNSVNKRLKKPVITDYNYVKRRYYFYKSI